MLIDISQAVLRDRKAAPRLGCKRGLSPWHKSKVARAFPTSILELNHQPLLFLFLFSHFLQSLLCLGVDS